jgi:FAD/FMN-containing dehydrogenase/Fe-S oxidoreductase
MKTIPDLLQNNIEGETLFDTFSKGLYSTDASIYQIEPVCIILPKNIDDVVNTLQIASQNNTSVTPRGAGTSQSGQSIGPGIIVDTSKFLNKIGEIDHKKKTIKVQPGVVLDHLNRFLEPHGLFFPVDVATSSRATIGGMTANNSAGSRSIKYGMMVDNVSSIQGLLPDGTKVTFGMDTPTDGPELQIAQTLATIRRRESMELEKRIPKVMRRVAGYNLDRISERGDRIAQILVGSEGTLSFFTEIELQLSRLPDHKVLGACTFPSLEAALNAVSPIVELNPSAVELIDGALIDLARNIPTLRTSIDQFVKPDARAVLLVEFSCNGENQLSSKMDHLEQVLSDLGHPKALLRAESQLLQNMIWSVRKTSMNIVMSMKGDKKPISFIEDCTIPLKHLAEYGVRLEEIFRNHGTSGTWYAHASVGCLHVRPILNLKEDQDLRSMRSIAEQTHELVREFKGTHSGEHGDGLIRSEFLEPMLGKQIVSAFTEIKDLFDPSGTLNPGKIVRPPKMDDRSLMRYKKGYKSLPVATALDWSPWGGWTQATEMCNNNGACRKSDPGVMCPSYRVTGDERHVPRGRVNSLRLALTGQLGPEALASEDMYQTLSLCVGCKACQKECPMSVDITRMKIEFLHHYYKKHGLPLRERLIAWLPRYAKWVSKFPLIANIGSNKGFLAKLGELFIGITAHREKPQWRSDIFSSRGRVVGNPTGSEIVLWVDTFNTYFEPENAQAAIRVLEAAGYKVNIPTFGTRPACCGRTFLNAGLIDEARTEAERLVKVLGPWAEKEIPIIGLEPSCLLTLRDELTVILPGERSKAIKEQAVLLDEFLVAEQARGRLDLELQPLEATKAMVHTHCHQKALGETGATEQVLKWIPNLDVESIQSGCCGMAGAFGYESEHYQTSLAMANLDLIPAVRLASPDTLIITGGTSCRHQIDHGTDHKATSLAQVLEKSLSG